MNDRVTLDHEKLAAYKHALSFYDLTTKTVLVIPRGYGALSDQLRRAASSIVCNIAEGAGAFRPKEKARFYRMARRSATECAAIRDMCECVNRDLASESGRQRSCCGRLFRSRL